MATLALNLPLLALSFFLILTGGVLKYGDNFSKLQYYLKVLGITYRILLVLSFLPLVISPSAIVSAKGYLLATLVLAFQTAGGAAFSVAEYFYRQPGQLILFGAILSALTWMIARKTGDFEWKRRFWIIEAALLISLVFFLLGRGAVGARFGNQFSQLNEAVVTRIASPGTSFLDSLPDRLFSLRVLIGGLAVFSTLILVTTNRKNPGSIFLIPAMASGLIGQTHLAAGNHPWGIRFYIFGGVGVACHLLFRKNKVTDRLETSDSLSAPSRIITLTCLMLLALWLSVSLIHLYPVAWQPYEANVSKWALRILDEGWKLAPAGGENFPDIGKRLPDVHQIIWKGMNSPGMAESHFCPFLTYPLALSFRLFSVNLVSLRLTSIGLGLIALLVFFLLARILVGEKAALLAAFFMAVSPWHLNLIRVSTIIAPTYLFTLLCYLLLWKGIETKKLIYFLFLGVVMSQSIRFYTNAKISVYISFLFLIYLSLKTNKDRWRYLKGLAVMSGALFMILYVQGTRFIHFWLYVDRSGSNAVWMPSLNRGLPLLSHPSLELISREIEKFSGSMLERLYYPQGYLVFNHTPYLQMDIWFHPLLAALGTMGFLLALMQWRREEKYLFLVIWIVTATAPGVISSSVARRLFFIPLPMYILAALAGRELFRSLSAPLSRRVRRIFAIAILPFLIIFLLSSGAAGYFENYRRAVKDRRLTTYQEWERCRLYICGLMDQYPTYLAREEGGGYLWRFRVKDAEISPHIPGPLTQKKQPLTIISNDWIPPMPLEQKIAVLLPHSDKYQKLRTKLSNLYPGLRQEEFYSQPQAQRGFTTFILVPDSADNAED